MVHLYTLPYSPWSEKARWALLHHQVAFREVPFVTLFGALPLRLATGYRGRLSIPLLDTGPGVVVDSCEIAQWADANGAGTPLFPPAHRDEILAWNRRAETAIGAARAVVLRRIAADPEALREGLPPQFPRWSRTAATPLARVGVAFIRTKWDAVMPSDEAVGQIWSAALEIRASLSAGRTTLLDGFTFADIAAAATLHCIQPVADRYVPIGPATRRVWTHPDLAAEFADLLAWRDALYASYRPPAPLARSTP